MARAPIPALPCAPLTAITPHTVALALRCSYLLFTTTDGAIRMIVLLHAYRSGFSAWQVWADAAAQRSMHATACTWAADPWRAHPLQRAAPARRLQRSTRAAPTHHVPCSTQVASMTWPA